MVVGCIGLGVIHAPGYPLFMLAGRLFSFLQVGNPAMTLNLFAAFLGAVASLLFFLNARLLLIRLSLSLSNSPSPFLSELLCLIATLNFSLSRTFWGNALAAKGGVYVFQIVLELSIFLAAHAILAKEKDSKKVRMFLLFMFLFSLGFCNHWPTQVLFAILLASWIYAQKSFFIVSSSFISKDLVYALALSLCALSLYLYLPLRAQQIPIIDFGAPTNFQRFVETVARTTYLKVETMATAPSGFQASLLHKVDYISDHTLREFCLFFSLFALGGIYFLLKWDKILCLASLGLVGLVLFVNLFYLQADPIEYWHIADHLLTNNWVTGFLGCIGMLGLLSTLNRSRKSLALICFAATLPMAYWNSIQDDNQTRQFLYFGYGLIALKSLPLQSVFFAEDDYDYFSVFYLTETLHKRPDAHLILTPFLDKPYQFEHMLAPERPLFEGHDGKYGKEQVFRALGNPQMSHPLYCAFPNASFSESYLNFYPRFVFEPKGLLTHILVPGEKAVPQSNFTILSEFYGHYLAPETSQPNEVNGLLREICAHPLLNAARYEKLFGNTEHWEWYHLSALKLIAEPMFFNETLKEFKSASFPLSK